MISVIIPIYNTSEELVEMTQDCIDSLTPELQDGDELLIIDDASPVAHDFGVRTITLPKNSGVAVAWNTGVTHAVNDIVLISNNDIQATHWRAPMLEALEKYAVVFPLVYNENTGRETRHLAGEFFMTRRALIEKVGGFNEDFGSYFEDTDFFMRVMNVGGKLGVTAKAYVAHRSQATVKTSWSPERLEENFRRNQALYEHVHGGMYPFLS